MPTIPSIRTSVENKNVLVLDEHAKNGTFERDARDRLIAYVGGFSVVFPYLTANGEKWVFRCWHAEVNNTKKRYEIISEAIKKAHLSFLCDFDYIENGINVEGIIYPTIRMRWVEGINIKDYICQNKNNPEILTELADNFLIMVRTLHANSLAHGDLQHGNILVSSDHQLHLVDYDSFFCTKLKGEPDNITGLPDYQHPSRKSNKSVSEKLDYFSELIIYLSILAIAQDASLADKYNINNADRLLFSKDDFVDIKNSSIYKDIQSLGDDFQDMLDVLELYLVCNDIDELEPFVSFLLKKKVKLTTSSTKAKRNTQTITISWDVPFEAEVYIKKIGEKKSQKCDKNGQLSTTLSGDATYELSIYTVDGCEINKRVSIDVFDECEIEFSSDKSYIFPTIPVVLTWKVKNGKKAWLNGEEVSLSGRKIIEPQTATTCILSAEDEFGKKEKQIEIGLLPIPHIKELLVPRPHIASNMSIAIKQPKFNVGVSFPHIEIGMVKAETPRVPSFTDLNINVELSPPLPEFSLRRAYKQIKQRIINRLNIWKRTEEI